MVATVCTDFKFVRICNNNKSHENHTMQQFGWIDCIARFRCYIYRHTWCKFGALSVLHSWKRIYGFRNNPCTALSFALVKAPGKSKAFLPTCSNAGAFIYRLIIGCCVRHECAWATSSIMINPIQISATHDNLLPWFPAVSLSLSPVENLRFRFHA